MKSTWISQYFLSFLLKIHDSFGKIDKEKNLMLKKADIQMTFNEYRGIALFSKIFATALYIIIFFLLYGFLSNYDFIFIIFTFIVIFCLLQITLFLLFLYLPLVKIKTRGNSIDCFLPYAVNYLNTMSSTGTSPVEMFQTLSQMDVYGSIQKEAKMITHEIELLGLDNITALKNAIERSPSEKFKEFLQGFIGTIQSGTSLNSYLSTTVNQYMEDDLSERKKNLENLGFIAEVFVMTVIGFPIFLVIILSVFSFIGSNVQNSVNVLYVLSFLFLPLAYLCFYILIRLVLFESVENSKKNSLKQRINEFFTFERQDFKIFLFTFTIELLFFAIVLIMFYFEIISYSIHQLLNVFFFSTLLFLGPYGIYNYFEYRKKQEIQKYFPDFLIEMSNSLKAGLNIFDSLKIAQQSKYGILTPEIKKINVDLSWRKTLKDALNEFSHRLKNGLIDRLIFTINKGIFMGGDTSSVFSAVARELKQINSINKQRSSEMSLYTIVILMSFFIFLFIVFILDNTLFSYFFEMQTSPDQSLPLFVSDINESSLHYGLFSFVFIQSLGSGILSGFMKEGSISSGMRYSFLLGLITIIVFTILF